MSQAIDKLRAAAARLAETKAQHTVSSTIQAPLSAAQKLQALLAKRKIEQLATEVRRDTTVTTQALIATIPSLVAKPDSKPLAQAAPAETVWNSDQMAAIELSEKGQSFCLIGSAGTGKTTTEREIIYRASCRIASEMNIALQEFQPSDYIIVCAFTRRAVRNTFKALRALGDKYTACCQTVHKALKYEPEYFDYIDEDGNDKTSMRFVPKVTAEAPNYKIQLIVIDEASMLGYQGLYRQLTEGFPNARYIYIGDLNQLKPVMDDPTLAYKLNDVPVVELTHVYRQALTSPIVAFQYDFTLAGKVPKNPDIAQYTKEKNGLSFFQIPWRFKDSEAYARTIVAKYFKPAYEAKLYNPDDAMILIPFNKKFGSVIINQEIAQFLGTGREATVYEIIAGVRKKYFAIGDYVLHDKRECVITNIEINSKYSGIAPKDPSPQLLRTGHYDDGEEHCDHLDILQRQDFVFASDGTTGETSNEAEEDRTQALKASSHVLTLRDRETGDMEDVSTIGDINSMDWSYCMTIHKSQGSEWRKVYLIVHNCHSTALSRELLYTGMTRAAEELVVCWSMGRSTLMSESSLGKAILRQDIKGKTWREKASAYNIKGENLLWRG